VNFGLDFRIIWDYLWVDFGDFFCKFGVVCGLILWLFVKYRVAQNKWYMKISLGPPVVRILPWGTKRIFCVPFLGHPVNLGVICR
jgi:hypothetical protein